MPFLVTVFFAALVALSSALYLPQEEARLQQAKASAGAVQALAYRAALVDYLNANPSFTGVVPDSSLTLLWGQQRDTRWTNVVTSSSLFVYESSPSGTPLLLDELYSKTLKSYFVGRNSSGSLVSANGFATGVTVPAAVPNGAILIAGK